MKFKAAFATDDGKTFMERHFGDALFYDIYEVKDDKALFVKRIENTVPEEEELHADPRKAKGISSLLLKENVTVVVSKIFGPNIKRIRKKFVCIVIKNGTIDDAVHRIIKNLDLIKGEWNKDENRSHLML
ncbi:MAG: dinitrogenase iron-molybdenum cofactor biosynthesis protein [Candidatus Cloacimonetes bacterium]|nr:dinitrogenase iron-molybdenum cofactor biosynthesis protein [Candidatus Cloacimonadota bacterium]